MTSYEKDIAGAKPLGTKHSGNLWGGREIPSSCVWL